MNENINPQNVSSKTAYVLTNKGVITLNADTMSPEDFGEITKQLSQIMSDIQCGKMNATSQSVNGSDKDGFSFTSSAPVKKEQTDDAKVASPTAFNLFDDDDVPTPDDDAAKEEQERLQNAAPVVTLTPNQGTDDKTRELYDAGIIFAEKKAEMIQQMEEEGSSPSIDEVTDAIVKPTEDKVVPNTNSQNASIAATEDLDTTEEDDIESYIKSTGYIDNANLWRRWIMAQMLRHYNKADGTSGFDEYFVTGTPYFYQWKVVASELKVLRHLKGQALTDRERFFNEEVVRAMARDYQKKISTYIMKSKKHRDRRFSHVPQSDHKRCMYVTIPGYNKKIYLDDNPLYTNKEKSITYNEFMTMVYKHVDRICNNRPQDYYHLHQRVEQFMKSCPLIKTFAKSSEWKNAFKGSGAYYTMDNMIKFHNCHFHIGDKILTMNESLSYLEQKTKEYTSEYYRLYALMRQFVSDNNFTYANIPVDNYHLPKYDG